MTSTILTHTRSTIQSIVQFIANLHLFALIGYYWQYGAYSILAVIYNRSFLLHHPNRTYPTLVSTPWVHTRHSFTPHSEVLLQRNLPFPPPQRIWSNPEGLSQRMANELPLTEAIILDGYLVGTLLCQGMGIIVDDDVIYIAEELGRWPTREDYVVTFSISMESGNRFWLFIPTRYLSLRNVDDESPPSPLRSPITISEALDYRRRQKLLSAPPLSVV